jgi:hypothetical protein
MFSWIIDSIIGNIPVWVWTAVAGGGAGAYFLSKFIPTPYGIVAKIFGIVAVLGGVFICGGAGVTSVMQDAIKEMQAKVAKAEQASTDANAKLSAALQTKTKTIHDTQVVVQEKIVHDAAQMDATCTIDPIAISDLNQAAGGKK